MSNLQHITKPGGVAPPSGLYSHAVKVLDSGLVFISGQTALNEVGNIVGENDVSVQTEQVFQNLGKVLSTSGSGFDRVLAFTIYLVGDDSVGDFLTTRKDIFGTIYPDGKYPCSTLVNVVSLGGGKALVEISAIAVSGLPA